jgi:hypothetical protein
MERSKDPFAVTPLLGVNAPDVVAFEFYLLSIFVEALDVLLSPEVVPDLTEV